MIDLRYIEEKVGYKFKDIGLLEIATRHKSYAYEQNDNNILHNNERMEFLGDAILDGAISDYLYNFSPYMKEGDMSKKRAELVCEKSLSLLIKKMGLSKYVKLGRCEIKTGGYSKNAILADMFEAIIGAVYLDSNFDSAKIVCLNIMRDSIDNVIKEEHDLDYKTRLQEILQKNGTVKIEYKLKEEKGKPHDKVFYIEVYFNDRKIGEGSGKTKKAAEQEAAKEAIKELDTQT